MAKKKICKTCVAFNKRLRRLTAAALHRDECGKNGSECFEVQLTNELAFIICHNYLHNPQDRAKAEALTRHVARNICAGVRIWLGKLEDCKCVDGTGKVVPGFE